MRRIGPNYQPPIRLGGAGARAAGIAEVVSLSALDGAEPFSAPLPETIAMDRLLTALSLDPDARRFLDEARRVASRATPPAHLGVN